MDIDKSVSTDREIVYVGGDRGVRGDFPVAVTYIQTTNYGGSEFKSEVVDPILSEAVFGNLYGRMLTLLEATTESSRLKAIKNVFSKELNSWYSDVYTSAREVVEGNGSSVNIYTRNSSIPSND